MKKTLIFLYSIIAFNAIGQTYNFNGKQTFKTNVGIGTYAPSANGTYRIIGYLTTTAISAGTLNFQLTYTDLTSGGTSRTQTFAIMGTTTQNITTTEAFTFPDIQIKSKSGNAITVLTTFTGV